jgi:hypothetical protein
MFHTIFIVLILTKYLLHIRYKLKFLASDGTETAEMFCFNNVARQIVGKSCEIVLRGVSEHSPIPPDLAQIISLKFTFRVTVDDQSFFQKKQSSKHATNQLHYYCTWKTTVFTTASSRSSATRTINTSKHIKTEII